MLVGQAAPGVAAAFRVVGDLAPPGAFHARAAMAPSSVGGTWTEMDPAVKPSARVDHAMVYDTQSDRVILFGGAAPYLNNETWAYDDETDTWTNLAPAGAPPTRAVFGMAYDAQSDRVILFGGSDGSAPLNDTWAYDYRANTWTEMSPTVSPPVRAYAVMAYDSESDRSILFGGWQSSGGYNDTWAYDFESNSWTELSPVVSPSARYYHAMAYDRGSDRVILFGGNDAVAHLADTWAYDDETNRWVIMAPSIAPPARDSHSMAYDAVSDRTLLFGGYVPGGPGFADDTWAYDYGTDSWTNLSPATSPPARNSAAMAYDSVSDHVVLFGGQVAMNVHGDDTWVFGYARPFPPQNLAASEGDAQVGLSWDPPVSHGLFPITNYRIYRGAAPGGESLLATVGPVFAYTDVGLTNGVRYYYQMSAVNAGGESPLSSEVSALPATVPSAPQSVTASAGDGQVVLAWTAPVSTGGTAITGYRVLRGTAAGGETPLAVVGNVLTFMDGGLANGATYFYEVTAVNARGEGARSAEVSATPTYLNTAPTASFTVVPSGGDTSTSFTFDASASSDVEDPASALLVRWDWQDNGAWDTGWSTTKMALHGFSTPGTYTIRLQVQDTGGLVADASRQVVVTQAAVVDTTRPSVSVTSPANRSTLTSATVTISGTASDNVAVQKVELSSDGTTWVLATGTTSWSRTMTLAEGSNTVYVKVTDTSGNTATNTLSITVQTAAGPSPQGLDPVLVVMIIAVVVAAGGIGAILVVRRIRARSNRP